jgi:uncharacterized protein
MVAISSAKPYRIGRSRTGLGLFATKEIKKGTNIIRYFGPLLDTRNKKHDEIDNKYLFEINSRWTIDGSIRKNIARYINHACRPNAESDVKSRERKVIIRAIKTIHPGEEINYDYGTDYFKLYLKPIGCKCASCEKRRKQKRAEERAENLRLKLKAEAKSAKAGKSSQDKSSKGKSSKGKSLKPKPAKAKTISGGQRGLKSAGSKSAGLATKPATPHARGTGRPTSTKASRTKPLSRRGQASRFQGSRSSRVK